MPMMLLKIRLMMMGLKKANKPTKEPHVSQY
jgi:hypothetical protein